MASAHATDFVDRVRAAVDIVDLISESVPLKRAGRKYRGLCPFHNEKTPSFYLDDEKGLFYCFGCQAGGDLFKFVMMRENVEFLDAARLLARRAGIPIPQNRPGGRRSERESLLAAHREAAEFYRENLRSRPVGSAARRYLRERGIEPETAERLGIGFAPDRWDALKGHLTRVDVPVRRAVTAGLLSEKEDGGRTYDRFRNRVLFPIRNLSGEVVGFGGRILGDGEPKYLNSADSPIYNKREILYGLDLTRGAIRDAGEAIVVEGYFDLASLVQAGIHEVVATLGTAFSEPQVALLRRFADRVVINYDPDTAGANATRRSIDLLLAQGFRVRVLRLPEGLDPDAFVREHGAEAYRARAAEAPRYFEYLIETASAGRDVSDHEVKSEILKEILPVIARVPDRIERSGQVNVLAERLGLEDDLMLAEIREALVKQGRARVPASATSPGATRTASRLTEAEGRLVRALVERPHLRADVMDHIDVEDLNGSPIEAIVRAMEGLDAEGAEVSYGRLSEILQEPARSVLAQLAVSPMPVVAEDEALRCLESIRLRRLKRRRESIQKEMETERDTARLDELMRLKIELSRQIDSLA